MAIYNKRLVMVDNKKDKTPLLNKVNLFLKKKLLQKEYSLRFAIVGIVGNKYTIDVTVMEK